ncbi:MAG: hypothetical protein R3B47_08345 [Bacteroidia bacterium]
MTTESVDKLNIGLVIAAFGGDVPAFELFLFSYAFLGPLHYLTEINWLQKRSYFVSDKRSGSGCWCSWCCSCRSTPCLVLLMCRVCMRLDNLLPDIPARFCWLVSSLPSVWWCFGKDLSCCVYSGGGAPFLGLAQRYSAFGDDVGPLCPR